MSTHTAPILDHMMTPSTLLHGSNSQQCGIDDGGEVARQDEQIANRLNGLLHTDDGSPSPYTSVTVNTTSQATAGERNMNYLPRSRPKLAEAPLVTRTPKQGMSLRTAHAHSAELPWVFQSPHKSSSPRVAAAISANNAARRQLLRMTLLSSPGKQPATYRRAPPPPTRARLHTSLPTPRCAQHRTLSPSVRLRQRDHHHAPSNDGRVAVRAESQDVIHDTLCVHRVAPVQRRPIAHVLSASVSQDHSLQGDALAPVNAPVAFRSPSERSPRERRQSATPGLSNDLQRLCASEPIEQREATSVTRQHCVADDGLVREQSGRPSSARTASSPPKEHTPTRRPYSARPALSSPQHVDLPNCQYTSHTFAPSMAASAIAVPDIVKCQSASRDLAPSLSDLTAAVPDLKQCAALGLQLQPDIVLAADAFTARQRGYYEKKEAVPQPDIRQSSPKRTKNSKLEADSTKKLPDSRRKATIFAPRAQWCDSVGSIFSSSIFVCRIALCNMQKDLYDTEEVARADMATIWSRALYGGLGRWIDREDDDGGKDDDGDGMSNETEEVMKSIYKSSQAIVSVFDFYASTDVDSPYDMGMNDFKLFVGQCGLGSREHTTCKLSDIDQTWVAINAKSKRLEMLADQQAKAGLRAPVRRAAVQDTDTTSLSIDEFVQMLVRIATMRFVHSGELHDVSEAVERLMDSIICPSVDQRLLSSQNNFRRTFLYTPAVDAVLWSHVSSLRAMFGSLQRNDGGRASTMMTLESWMEFVRRLELLGTDLTERDATLSFMWSRMAVPNRYSDMGQAKTRHLPFEGFLEGLVRLSAVKALPTDEEIASSGHPDAGMHLLSMVTSEYSEFIRSRAVQWLGAELKLCQPIDRCVEHLLCLIIRTIKRSSGRPHGLLQVTSEEMTKFFPQSLKRVKAK